MNDHMKEAIHNGHAIQIVKIPHLIMENTSKMPTDRKLRTDRICICLSRYLCAFISAVFSGVWRRPDIR